MFYASLIIFVSSDDRMKKTPIKRKSLAEEVAELLRKDIVNGTYPLNSKLATEPELMQRFGVGRSTIREAIKYLAQQGFVYVQQGLGTFVQNNIANNIINSKIEQADFEDIFEVRQLLEVKIIQKAAINRQDIHIEKMKAALELRKHFAQTGSLQECLNADISFHKAIAESCGNSILFALYNTLSDHIVKFFRKAYKDTFSFTISQDSHEELLQAIIDKNETKALTILEKIIRHK